MDAVQKTPSAAAASVHLTCGSQPEAAGHGSSPGCRAERGWLREAGWAEAHTHGQPGQPGGACNPGSTHTATPSHS